MSTPQFISLDGIDGVGKSTQIERLADQLRALGQDVLCVRDPGSTDIGQRLRGILLDSEVSMHRRTEAMLFMASRSEMVETIIRPALAKGTTVISDRFLLANVVYQSVTDEGTPAKDVTPELLWSMGRLACGDLNPCLTVLLDLDAETACLRLPGAADRMEARGTNYLANVREAFLEQLPFTGGRTAVVSAAPTPDEVAEQVAAAVFTE